MAKRTLDALHGGEVDKVVAQIDALSEVEGARAASERRDYFVENAHRMQYPRMRQLGLPEGSGAIESAIRRVVNLRMKGNAKYWKEENAEAMLTIRGHLKSGRFRRLMRWWRRQRTHWWTGTDRRLLRVAESEPRARKAA